VGVNEKQMSKTNQEFRPILNDLIKLPKTRLFDQTFGLILIQLLKLENSLSLSLLSKLCLMKLDVLAGYLWQPLVHACLCRRNDIAKRQLKEVNSTWIFW
jgi:hypothetical protein